MSAQTILVADDDSSIRTVLNQALTRAGYEVRPTGNMSTLWSWVSRGEGDLVITDVAMPDGNVFDLFPRMKKMRKNLPILVMSAQNTFMTAIQASEAGAYEYLPKPFDLSEMISVVGRALSEVSNERTSPTAHMEADDSMPLVGRSSAMQDIYRSLARLMQTALTVMINGESGTGKELVARALHDFGKRRNGPYVAINMAAIPHDLIESDLFGHEKGAFTGAHNRSVGRFEQAEGGTLFLDEIGDMPLDAQTRLLRVLQEGEFTRIGGHTPIKTHVRIVAATHRDLNQLIRQGQFREDLFYRLNVVPLRVPALRERLDDVPDLVRHFFKLAAQKSDVQTGAFGTPKTLTPEAMSLLQVYHWPGNVRELENLISRLAALYSDDVLSKQVVEHELNFIQAPANITAHQDVDLSVATERHLTKLFADYDLNTDPAAITDLYQAVIDKVERPLITAALSVTGGNQIKAADLLGVNRNTLRKKIKNHKIEIIKQARTMAAQ